RRGPPAALSADQLVVIDAEADRILVDHRIEGLGSGVPGVVDTLRRHGATLGDQLLDHVVEEALALAEGNACTLELTDAQPVAVVPDVQDPPLSHDEAAHPLPQRPRPHEDRLEDALGRDRGGQLVEAAASNVFRGFRALGFTWSRASETNSGSVLTEVSPG